MGYIVETREIPVKEAYDVVVAGAGVAGLAAALAARRAGKRVLVLEKSTMLGGLATLGQINYFVPMCNGRGRQITKGMVDEFIALATRYGYDVTPESWKHGEPGPTADGSLPRRYDVRYSACMFALALTEMVQEEDIHLSFDTLASEPVMKGQHCEGLIVENKSGRQFYPAGAWSWIARATRISCSERACPRCRGTTISPIPPMASTLRIAKKPQKAGVFERAIFDMPGGTANLFGKNQPEGKPLYTGTSGEDVNQYLFDNQLTLLNRLKKDDRRTRQVISLPGMCQYRTTRRIDGDYTLKVSDVYRHFADSITAVNDFEHRNFLYEIPYRTLVRKGYDNLITAGRSASGEGYAWDIVRVIPPAILTGQAVGCAAAQALSDGVGIDGIDVPKLQNTLARQNVLLHFDDSWIPKEGEPEVKEGPSNHI